MHISYTFVRLGFHLFLNFQGMDILIKFRDVAMLVYVTFRNDKLLHDITRARVNAISLRRCSLLSKSRIAYIGGYHIPVPRKAFAGRSLLIMKLALGTTFSTYM